MIFYICGIITITSAREIFEFIPLRSTPSLVSTRNSRLHYQNYLQHYHLFLPYFHMFTIQMAGLGIGNWELARHRSHMATSFQLSSSSSSSPSLSSSSSPSSPSSSSSSVSFSSEFPSAESSYFSFSSSSSPSLSLSLIPVSLPCLSLQLQHVRECIFLRREICSCLPRACSSSRRLALLSLVHAAR